MDTGFWTIVWNTFRWATAIFYGLLLVGAVQLALYVGIAELYRKYDRDREKRSDTH